MNRKVRAVLAHPGELSRRLFCRALLVEGIGVVAEASSLPQLVAQCAAERPDVAIGWVSARDRDHVLSTLGPLKAPFVVVSDDEGPEWSTCLLEAGADAIVRLDAPLQDLTDAVRAVASGHAALEPATASMVLRQWREMRREVRAGQSVHAALTRREAEVLEALAEGLATRMIARRLEVSLKTVEHHKSQVFRKLGARNQSQAVSLAIGFGLLRRAEPS